MDIDLDALEARARDTSNWMVPFDSDRGAYFNIGMGEMFALIRFARDLDAAGETLSAGVDEFATILEERNRKIAALTAQLAERDARIAALREAIDTARDALTDWRERAERLARVVAERDTRIAALQEAVRSMRATASHFFPANRGGLDVEQPDAAALFGAIINEADAALAAASPAPAGATAVYGRWPGDESEAALLAQEKALDAPPAPGPVAAAERPTVVCLCGSTRFWRTFQRASLAEAMAGRIVLSIGAATGTDDEHFGNLPKEEYDHIKEMLDTLHLRKIDMADEILVLNESGYIGESTAREVAYAASHGKHIRWWSADGLDAGSRERLTQAGAVLRMDGSVDALRAAREANDGNP